MNVDKLFNIEIIEKDFLIPDFIDRVDLSRDIIFTFPESFRGLLGFDYSGLIQFGVGEDVNISIIKNRINPNSPFRIHKAKIPIKFCCPCGIAPVFLKPNNAKSILGINHTYENFVDFKTPDSGTRSKTKKCQETNVSVIYQSVELETTFNRDILITEYPSMILPKSYRFFDLMFTQTVFSDTLTIGRVYVIKNNEFFSKFKESI